MIDLRRLRALRELAERGTIAAAAEALHLTPSAVSQQLAALEREIGQPLVEPDGRSVRLTPAARGRGLGLAALAHATDLARPHATRLELAVDVRNVPARRLYQAAGLRAFDRRAVHIVTLA